MSDCLTQSEEYQASLKRYKNINAKPKAFAKIENLFSDKLVNPMASIVGSVLVSVHGNRNREIVRKSKTPELVLAKY